MVSSNPAPSRDSLATTSRPSLALLNRRSAPKSREPLMDKTIPNVANRSSQGRDVPTGKLGLGKARDEDNKMRVVGNPGADAEELDHTESLERSLAFAVRARASGSGLPRNVAELKRMIDVAPDNDAETAELFAELVSRKIHLDRRLQTQVSRFLDQEPEVQHWSAGKNNPDKNANPDLTEEQRLLGPWVERMAAYRRYHGKSRESASNQGAAPVRGRKSCTARSLRDILLAHRGEIALHKECYAYGIPYHRPRTLRLHGENTPVDGRFGRPRRLHSLRNLTSDLSRKLLPQKQARRRGPPMSIALREALEDLALM
ncbi:uncharacterized protein TRAVEDRAFT_65584 [Trametes versicolor FP-101664 SS1]|uniref:uncharacterized protein n=1 Tax=Trametes versicolor (strain FP-101664) TaxID=717944 RepID=UPI0004621A91|nr:uncharacterized protein TRAVEDRAFT_65584 [Trametes versicolor FP-101664 SS1]EIW58063.1 hypothetical protein TRAVEDRAFT_65584 [Trametes versicolor FP-101664 SS1]